jgi:two-component system sensor histidine kinase MprB
LTLAGGLAVFTALSIASLVIYFEVESKLHDQIDASLVSIADNVAFKFTHANDKAFGPKAKLEPPPNKSLPLIGSEGSVAFEIIPSVGQLLKGARIAVKGRSIKGSVSGEGTGPDFVPLLDGDLLVADQQAPSYYRDVSYRHQSLRLYSRPLGVGDGLVRTARPLTEADATIGRVRWLLIALTLGGALAAALFGRLAAAAVLRPVRRLAHAVDDVTTTRDLSRRIDVEGRDEIGSLAGNFNRMLGALDQSLKAQQQLIADASHELRTPLTAHRTNIELLARADLPRAGRERALNAALRGVEELSALVNDLITAARNGRQVDAREPLDLAQLVDEAIKRAKARPAAPNFTVSLESHPIVGAPLRLERALDNVVDNAVKWNTNGQPIEVTLRDGVLTVRDHGPGVDADDLPHVFDRFYRAAAARSQPGSGLGLAIVKETVHDHGGEVALANADGGGARVTMTLPRA